MILEDRLVVATYNGLVLMDLNPEKRVEMAGRMALRIQTGF